VHDFSPQELIKQLEHGARKLPADEREAFLDEIRCHLEASIQARIELGASFEQACQEAVSEFGPPKLISQRLLKVHAHPPDRPFAVTAFSFVAAFAGLLALNWNKVVGDQSVGLPFTVLLCLGISGMLYTAYRARKFQWKTVLLLYPVASVIFAVAGASAYAPDTVPPAMGTAYADAAKWAGDQLRQAEQFDAQAETMRHLRSRFEAGENVGPPKGQSWTHSEGVAMPSREAAEKAWERERFDYAKSAQWARDEANHLLSLNHALWWQGIPNHLIGMQPIAAPLALIIGALGLIGSATAEFVQWLRRRRRFRGLRG
jgi:hypothetical protein